MSRVLSIEPVAVRIGDCECPGTPHTGGDHAYFRPRLTAAGGLHALAIVNDARAEDTLDLPRLIRDLGMLYLEDGLLRWDLLDDSGAPVPLSAVRDGSLDWGSTLLPLASRADALYQESVLFPFQPAKAPKSSPTGQTDDSTSASPDS